MQTRTITEVVATIKAGHGLTKTVTVADGSDRCLDYLLEQLADPVNKRPVKALNGHFRHRVYNPRTDSWSYREVETAVRGANKNHASHTKKTATAYLPPDGMTQFFKPKNGNPIILVFDGRLCHLKNEKYMFATDAGTDLRWWLKNKHGYATRQSIGYTGVKQVIDEQRAANIVPEPSELLVGLSKPSLQAILVVKDITANRLRALYTQHKIIEMLQIDVPIILITSHGMIEYSFASQRDDLTLVVKYPYAYISPTFTEKLFSKFSMQLITTIRASLSSFDYQAYEEDLATTFEMLPPELQFSTLEYLPLMKLARLYYLLLRDPQPSIETLQKLKEIIRNVSLIDLKEIAKNYLEQSPNKLVEWEGLDCAGILNKDWDLFRLRLQNNKDWISERIFIIFLFNATLSTNQTLLMKHGLATLFHLHLNAAELIDFIPNQNTLLNDTHHEIFMAKVIKKYDVELLSWLQKDLTELPKMSIRIVYDLIRTDSGRWLRYQMRRIIISPILLAVLERRFEMALYIIKNNPNEYKEAVSQLKELQKKKLHKSRENNEFLSHQPYRDNFKTIKILLNSLDPFKSETSWTSDQKRVCTYLLLSELKTLQTPESVFAFWEKHKDASYLNARRHRFFDRVFRSNTDSCASKKELQAAVTERYARLDNSR